MPNWCNNTVTISHDDRAKMLKLARAIRAGNFCNSVIPVPKDLTDTVAGYPGADKEAEHKLQMERNLERYGAKDWYDFCVARWGTKWDVDAYDRSEVKVDVNNSITFGFDSAWSPPTGVYEQLVQNGFSVRAYYYESGMAFCGVWEDMADDYWEIGGMSSTEVADTLPEDLDEMFAISETIANYEEENKDELEQWYEEGVESKGLEPHK